MTTTQEKAVDGLEQQQLLIGGRFIDADGTDRYEVVSPCTEEHVGSVPVPTPIELSRALRAARDAADDGTWGRTSPEERARALERIADNLANRAEESARLFTIESGTPITMSRGLLRAADIVLRTFADLARSTPLTEERVSRAGVVSVVKEAVGVVASIAPWNGPIAGISHSLAPALATGCTMVVKPAAETPLSVVHLAEAIVEADLPPGVVSILPGDAAVGESLIHASEVDKIAFTGSTAVGKHIMTVAAERMVRLTLELGGKGPAILCPDVDPVSVAALVVRSGLANAGQVCAAQTRLLVPSEQHDAFVAALVDAAAAMRLGNPLDPETDIGPLTTRKQRSRVEAYLDLAIAEGATLALGGGRPASQPRGWFIEPTIFTGVRDDMRIAQEEVFGPVLVVIPYENLDDAVRIANNSRYGLNASVWTGNIEQARTLAAEIRCGQVHINGFGTCPGLPFGGFRESGIGRKGGREGFESYLETKVVQVHGSGAA